MKKRVATISAVLVLACAVVALYWYIDRSGGAKKKTTAASAVEQMLTKDLESNYPPTPYAVAELYCSLVECLYSKDTTEEQQEGLVKLQLQLFDEEFAALNPYEQYLAATREELSEAKKKGIIFTGYLLDKASNVERWDNESGNYASLQLQLLLRSDEGSGTSYRKLIMRKDKEGRYKILGWKMAEEGGNSSADTGD